MTSSSTRFLAVVEWADPNYTAYLPDVPGCIATGDTVTQAIDALGHSLRIYFSALTPDQRTLFAPRAVATHIEVS